MHYNPQCIAIDTLNLSSFEYSCRMGKTFYVTAPRLLKVFWDAAKRQQNPVDLNASEAQENPDPFGPIASLRHIENLAMICSPSQVSQLKHMFST